VEDGEVTEWPETVRDLPTTPGVYLMKDEGGNVLYIGKALDIKKRVSSYFRNRAVISPKISVLLTKVRDIDCIETATEVDALLLESQLIRKFQPRYNTLAKDDKSFPFIKITGDRFPMIHITRAKGDRHAAYFGPFTDAGLLREAVGIIHRIFPLRKCMTLPKEACLYYHIGQCLAPCIKPEVKPEYDKLVEEVKAFMGGGKKTLMDYLSAKMKEAAGRLAFEEAQFYKGQIQALGNLRKKRFYRSRDISGVSLAATAELKRALGLRKFPERIVCFDVSNIAGSEPVASRVSFYYEMPDKNEYRRYRIRTVVGIDDYAMIQEALQRMLRGIKEGKEAFLPDLILIDGGKGHLAAAFQVLKKEGFEDVALASIAKRFEHLFMRDSGDPVILPEDSKALHLVKRIRDEAHRFAITYHRKLHTQLVSQSILDKIEGVGPRRKRVLLGHFGSIEKLAEAAPEELAALPTMNRVLACRILAYLKQDPSWTPR
jgi:excinuclease ABC subunit C